MRRYAYRWFCPFYEWSRSAYFGQVHAGETYRWSVALGFYRRP